LTLDKSGWAQRLAPFKRADNRRAIFEVVVTFLPFIIAWGAVWALLQVNFALALLAAIPAAGFMVRLFMIQHDCGHGSMFSSRAANDWVGRIAGIFTLTPYDYWRQDHARHHASSGNLDHRGFGDIDTLTVDEYLALSRWGRLRYRLYRHPLVMFGLGPSYLFLVRHRWPAGRDRGDPAIWRSFLTTNLGIALAAAPMIYVLGFWSFLLVHLPIVLFGASIGVWLFYVQHQFDGTYWARDGRWSHEDGALEGSSYYDLPRPLMWITGNIGVHHVHHLSSRIPFYRLPQVLEAYPILKTAGRLSIRQSLSSVGLALWDEARGKLISFRDCPRPA
jgi:acyl-lipid omega-6 desaturase (Delta-12 desaturase)